MRHRTGIVHHVGTFLLFAAAILLLVTTISAPVVKDIAILKVMLTNHTDIRNSSVTFGTFGHCILDVAPVETDQDYCYPVTIGYDPASIMAQIDGTEFSTAGGDTVKSLTKVMILHPIACGLAFIAFLLALGAGCCGSILASVISFFAWLITLIVMACDFASFGIIKNNVNSDGTGSNAYYSIGMWTILVAMICLFFATFLVLFTCVSNRRLDRVGKPEYADGGVATTFRRRRFWERSSRY